MSHLKNSWLKPCASSSARSAFLSQVFQPVIFGFLTEANQESPIWRLHSLINDNLRECGCKCRLIEMLWCFLWDVRAFCMRQALSPTPHLEENCEVCQTYCRALPFEFCTQLQQNTLLPFHFLLLSSVNNSRYSIYLILALLYGCYLQTLKYTHTHTNRQVELVCNVY